MGSKLAFAYQTTDTAATVLATPGYFDAAATRLPVESFLALVFSGGDLWLGAGMVIESTPGHCRIALTSDIGTAARII